MPPSLDVCRACARRVPWLCFAGNLLLTFYKLIVGYLGHSPALMADGLHSFTDVIGTSVIIASTRVAERPADDDYQYGYGKAEFLSSMFVYIVLLGIAAVIFTGGLHLLLSGHSTPPKLITFFGGLVSILYNVIMYRLGQCAGHRTHSPALLANSFENRADAVSSFAVCIGILLAILIHPACDPITAIIVAVIILINSITEMRKALGGLMDRGLSTSVTERIRRVVAEQRGVAGVSFVRSRSTGVGFWVDVGIEVRKGTTVTRAESIADKVRETLKSKSKHFARIEVYVQPEAAR